METTNLDLALFQQELSEPDSDLLHFLKISHFLGGWDEGTYEYYRQRANDFQSDSFLTTYLLFNLSFIEASKIKGVPVILSGWTWPKLCNIHQYLREPPAIYYTGAIHETTLKGCLLRFKGQLQLLDLGSPLLARESPLE